MKLHKKLIATLVTLMLVVGLLVLAVPASAGLLLGVITLSAVSGTPGAVLTVTGTGGFTAPGPYTVTFGTTVITSTGVVVGTGFPAFSFAVPTLPRGVYNVNVTTALDTLTAIPTFTITPTVTLSTYTVNSGDSIYVSGRGFNASQSVSIYVDSTFVTAVSSLTDGTFSNVPVTLPTTLAAGAHAVYGSDSSGAAPIVNVTVVPKMTISSASVAVGSAINVSGSAFAASSTITFYLDGVAISGSASTDTTGAFAATAVTIPAVTGGTHTLKAQDASGNSDSRTFTVTSKSSITPITGPAGTNVSISGSGFTSNANITITYNGAVVTTSPATITSDSNGNVVGTFKTPAGPSSAYTVTISDGTSTSTATFTSVATASINPVRGNVGSVVQVTGAGYKASTTVTISYNNSTAGSATSDVNGNFTANVNVPPAPTGDRPMTISDGTNSVNQTFGVTPTASMDPTSGNVGTTINLKGTGLAASRGITVKYDSADVTTTAPTTDSSGNLNTTFKAPVSKGGSHAVSVTDGVNTMNFSYAMDSTAPPAPAPQLPVTNTQAEEIPSLKWSEVSDPSMPVTYNLQIATDAAFSVTVITKTGLTNAGYTLTAAEKLPNRSKQAPYYWRVQSVDSASNVSAWSNANTFFIGFVMPSWVLYIIFGFGAIVLGVLGFWLGRRRAMSL